VVFLSGVVCGEYLLTETDSQCWVPFLNTSTIRGLWAPVLWISQCQSSISTRPAPLHRNLSKDLCMFCPCWPAWTALSGDRRWVGWGVGPSWLVFALGGAA
jgi:hypothetical protein